MANDFNEADHADLSLGSGKITVNLKKSVLKSPNNADDSDDEVHKKKKKKHKKKKDHSSGGCSLAILPSFSLASVKTDRSKRLLSYMLLCVSFSGVFFRVSR